MHSNPDDAMIVKSMVDLGHSLNMKVVAEGIETAYAADALADLHCDIGQGYHLCRPALPKALVQWHGQHAVRPRPQIPAATNGHVQPPALPALPVLGST